MNQEYFEELISFLERLPAIDLPAGRRSIGTGKLENGNWWVKFKLNTSHPFAWRHVQELGYVLNSLSVEESRFSEASEKLQHSTITQRELLADLLNSISSTRLSNYLEVRSNQSLEELKNYKSSSNDQWVEPACQ